ncbi:MAG TPA: hypothetical protein VFS07_05395 [Gemmatimonadales bacterium]|nr:hypothetical protein [Gemmatimonadales bacterium]
MRQNGTAQVLIEAVDKLGGPVDGSWTAGSPTGPFTIAKDDEYRPVSSGPLKTVERFVLSASNAGDGSVTITGTGGTITIPVRIAPDTGAFAATISDLNPAIGATVDITAPAGVRFTAGTTVDFYSGPLAIDKANGLAAPQVTAFSGDSATITVLPAPGATGFARISGIASVSTPTLTTTARTVDSITVPGLSSFPGTPSDAAPAVNTPITLTMGANFKFRPNIDFTGGAGAITGAVLSVAADSLSATVLPPPGAAPLDFNHLLFTPLPDLDVSLPTAATITVGAAPDLGGDDPFAGPVAQLTAPTVVGTATASYDQLTLGAPDYVDDGGIAASQLYELSFPSAGDYRITVSWDNESDVDAFLIDGGFNSIIGQSFNGAGDDESIDYTAGAGELTYLEINMYAGAVPPTLMISVKRIN